MACIHTQLFGDLDVYVCLDFGESYMHVHTYSGMFVGKLLYVHNGQV